MVKYYVVSIINENSNNGLNCLKGIQDFKFQILKRGENKLSFCVSKMNSQESTAFLKQQKVYNDKCVYRNHLRSCRDRDPHLCNICGKSFAVPARLIRHYRTHTGEKPYQCEYCSKSFSVKENLSVHRRIHTKERPYKCDVCESAFEHSGKLHRHMRIHTGERPHKCSLCSKTFIQSGQLVIHMRTHTGEKPYVCKTCEKGFTCSKQLKVHTRTHTGEKPYKCDICGKSFGYNHVLKLHQVAHYGEKFYKCTICQETFNSKKFMESHIKTHSDSLAYTKNSLKSVSTAFESTNNEQNILLYDNVKELNDDKILRIENTRENKQQWFDESIETNRIEDLSVPATILFYDSIYKNDNEAHEKISEIISNQSLPSLNKNTLILKRSRAVNSEIIHAQDVSIKKQTPTHRKFITTFDSTAAYFYKIRKGNIFSKETLSTLCLQKDNILENIESHLTKVKSFQSDFDKESVCEKSNSSMLYKSMYLPSCSNSLDLIHTKEEDNFSLPPRKRCKMILESMEKSDLMTTKRFDSVIQYAKLN